MAKCWNVRFRIAVRRLARDYPVVTFVLVTFAWTWTINFTLRAVMGARPTESNHGHWMAVFVVATYGPTVGALVTTALRGGWPALTILVRRILPWRTSATWCLIAFALPVLIDVVAVALYTWRGGTIGPIVAPSVLPTLAYLGVKVTRGPMAEELGWRGFALPALQARYGALKSSLVIGTLWFLWHLPMIWMAGTFISGPWVGIYPLAWFWLSVLCLAILMTWVVNHAKGSIVPAVMLHWANNAVIPFLFLPELSGEAARSIVYLSAVPMVCLAIAVSLQRPHDLRQLSGVSNPARHA